LLHVYETSSAFCFHNINAWEEDDGNTVVIDLALYKDNSPINDLLIDNILARHAEYTHSPLVRFTLTNIKRHTRTARRVITKRVVYGGAIELPRINTRRHMKPYTYVYGVSAREHGHIFDRLIKVNVRTGKPVFWDVEGHFPAEPIFIPTPNGYEEDDGVLLRYT
jgi:carotenoid cleavage dioxygenase-like enzyme